MSIESPLTDREHLILEDLEQLVRRGASLEAAIARMATISSDRAMVERVVMERQRIADSIRRQAIRSAVGGSKDGGWYTGPRDDDIFWPSLRSLLVGDLGWASAVPSLDKTSTDVVGLLASPHSPEIRTRGLVVGYVQSGKTANFTATIAKAADAGYRMFIVLSGVHNALRRQTQLRLDSQLHELNPTRWLQLTDEHSDFGNPVKALALVQGTELRLVAVVKKNVSRLTRLGRWLRAADAHGGLDTCPVLIIDDESDQASPNAATADTDRTQVNRRIVELLELPRVAYVGYTATPFANVLINPADAQDLYPRDFIYALPKPDSYLGAEELFGEAVSEDEAEEAHKPRDVIRLVPDSEAGLYRTRRRQPYDPVVTPSLKEAIGWFVLAAAERRRRDGRAKHCSMLVHTTMNVDPQHSLGDEIRAFVRQLRREWGAGSAPELEALWGRERLRSAVSAVDVAEFPQLVPFISDVISGVKVVVDNSRSDDRLLYADEPATVIAVGGNTLSRGLTLEGLVSSFFLRSSNTYDSLLQMGRWFGYRAGYADLPRIWTTEDLRGDFEFLSEVEAEIRRDIARYAEENLKPSQLPVRIRLHPRLSVTAANKMRFAVPGQTSYGGTRPQTTYFNHRDGDLIERNRKAAQRLLNGFAPSGELRGSSYCFLGVPATKVLEFVEAFEFHGSTDLRSGLLADYIKRQHQHGALMDWNVVVVSRQGVGRGMDLGIGEDVRLITRSRLKRSSDAGTACIGTLMSRPDRVLDLMDPSAAMRMSDSELQAARTTSGRGLLLLYPIDMHSVPKAGSDDHREGLGAEADLIGVAFSFPDAHPDSEDSSTIQADIAKPMSMAGTGDPDDDLDEPYEDKEGEYEVNLGE